MRVYMRVGNSIKYTLVILSLQATERLFIQWNEKNLVIFVIFN